MMVLAPLSARADRASATSRSGRLLLVRYTPPTALPICRLKIQVGITFRYFEAYMSMVVMYWLIVLVLEQFQRRYENRLRPSEATVI